MCKGRSKDVRGNHNDHGIEANATSQWMSMY